MELVFHREWPYLTIPCVSVGSRVCVDPFYREKSLGDLGYGEVSWFYFRSC
jgi:hypothetical protein